MKLLIGEAGLYVVRFDPGEDVIAALGTFAQAESVDAGHFSAIGAAGQLVVSYYDLPTKQYQDKAITENVEIVSLMGNIAWMEGVPMVHAHGVFSRSDFSTFGGHVKKLIVSATCEVHVSKVSGLATRGFDEVTGLNVLQ
jgi:predicted DNA-binding protein with PD1-like motif